jgi:hypothetical protein
LEIAEKIAARLAGPSNLRAGRLKEYLLPLKEDMMSLATACEADSEPKILELAAVLQRSFKVLP